MTGVVVTGACALTPLGRISTGDIGPLRDGRSAIGPISRFDASDFPARAAAEVSPNGQDDDQVLLGLAAARGALGDVDRRRGICPPARVGVFIGAEPERLRVCDWAAVRSGDELPAGSYRRRSPARLTDAVAGLLGAMGPRRTLSMACVSSASALAAAARAVRRGEVDLAVAGGAALNVEPLLFAGFCLLGAMSPSGRCRPFDLHRDGFVLGDGAAMLLLEAEERVRAQGRAGDICGRILGAGESVDGYRMTDPAPEGRGARAAIAQALTEAGLAPRDVAAVKAHATGTPGNDQVEAQVIHDLFGPGVPVLAFKGALGHGIAASGAVEVVATLAALHAGIAPPVCGLETPDPALPPIGTGPGRIRGGVALCNTFGFGGLNCALLVGAA